MLAVSLIVVGHPLLTSLANPELNSALNLSRDALDMSECLHDIVEEAGCSIGIGLALPVGEAIAEENINTTSDQGIGTSVLEFVPAVRGSDFETREATLDIVDLRQQLWAREIATV